MKNLLSVLATVGIVVSSAVSVVACGKKVEDKEVSKPKDELTQVVRNFEQNVTKIWTEHYQKEVATNLITLEDVNNDYEFLFKSNIQYYSKPDNKKSWQLKRKNNLLMMLKNCLKLNYWNRN